MQKISGKLTKFSPQPGRGNNHVPLYFFLLRAASAKHAEPPVEVTLSS